MSVAVARGAEGRVSGSSTARRLVTLSGECSGATQSFTISVIWLFVVSPWLVGVAAPGAPADIKVAVSSSNSLVVSWLPPNDPNGLITKYNLYNRWLSHSTHIEISVVHMLGLSALFIAAFFILVLVWRKSGNSVYSWIIQTTMLLFEHFNKTERGICVPFTSF